MKPLLQALILGALLASELFATQTYILTDKQGREIAIKNPYYDGADKLKVTRKSDGRTFNLFPSLLTPESWQKLNEDVTRSMGVSLDVRPIAIRKDKQVHWITDYGSHDTTKRVQRNFTIKVSSVSHFSKTITVRVFFLDGNDNLNIQSQSHTLSRNTPFNYTSNNKAEERTLKLAALGITYEEGAKTTDTNLVVTVEHSNGNIAATYSTNQSALDVVLAYYSNKK